jgi:hypothetical protein
VNFPNCVRRPIWAAGLAERHTPDELGEGGIASVSNGVAAFTKNRVVIFREGFLRSLTLHARWKVRFNRSALEQLDAGLAISRT